MHLNRSLKWDRIRGQHVRMQTQKTVGECNDWLKPESNKKNHLLMKHLPVGLKRSFFLFFLSIFLLSPNFLKAQRLEKALSVITPELMEQHIGFLASDSMKGRNTPGPELDRAAGYLAAEFTSLGIAPVRGLRFQEVPLQTTNLDQEGCLFSVTREGKARTFRLKSDYTPFDLTADTLVRSSLVFAGYGITAPEYGYDDYKDLDVKGKIVLIMKHEPGEKDSTSRFKGLEETSHSLLTTKLENARNHGAIGILLVTDPLNHMLLTPQGYPWPGLSKFLPSDNLPVELAGKSERLPFVQVGETVIKALFGSIDSLKNIQRRMDASLAPLSFEFPGTECTLRTALTYTRLTAKNVVGMIEGRHRKLKSEVVVVGGHYDHVGFLKNAKEGEDPIFNGADDNASGTAGVMAVARAFKSMKKRPSRSVLFILFAGEELGLYGSKHYCRNPLLPLDKTVVMLNLDMISRNGTDTLQISGMKHNPDLAEILLRESEKVGLKNTPEEEDHFSRSDHYNFFKEGVSAVNITTGIHDDYHKVSDDPASVDPGKAARVAALTFLTAWKIAGDDLTLEINP